MKANEFVKKHGIDKVKDLLDDKSVSDRYIYLAHGVHVKDLKRLVESYELVESNGGYNSVKAMFEDLHCMDLEGWNNDLELLSRAMSDVESCQWKK